VRRILAHPALEEFTLPADNRGRQNLEFSQLERKKRVLGKFRDQLLKLGAGHFCFFSRRAASASMILANGRR
jgi:hypothetical protein